MNKVKNWLLPVFLTVLTAVALIQYISSGLARRTFVFYNDNDGAVTVEERMIRVSGGNLMRSSSHEVDITRYVEEALLGPVSPDSFPLFSKETRLLSLLYRNGIVYVDLSKDAAMPLPEGASSPSGDVLGSLTILYSGLQRNFPYIRDIRFFIAGKSAYPEYFNRTGEFPAKKEI